MSKSQGILLVDDDVEVLQIHKQYLSAKGYTVWTAASALDALALLREQQVACIVLDVMMPDLDGFAAYPLIRRLSDAPVLFMTGKSSDEDRIRGLMMGADDYIIKPCSMEELSLRIAINIRKSQVNVAAKDILEFPPLQIDVSNHTAYCSGEKIMLSNKEYELLLLFARHPNEMLTFEQIGTELNGSYLEADRKTVMVNTSRLRKRLEQYPGLENKIETVWGKGYRLVR